MDRFPSSYRRYRAGAILGKTAEYDRGHVYLRVGTRIAGYTVKPRETRETGGKSGTCSTRSSKFRKPRTLPRLTSRAFRARRARRACVMKGDAAMTQGIIVGVLLAGLVGLIWVIVLDILGDAHHRHDNRQGSASPEPHDGEKAHGMLKKAV